MAHSEGKAGGRGSTQVVLFVLVALVLALVIGLAVYRLAAGT